MYRDPEIERLFTGDRGYANPTYDTDERTCYNGHVIPIEDDALDTCRECEAEQRRAER